MGTIASRDTRRRISFDNKFALNSAITVPKSLEDESLLNFDNIETTGELIFIDSGKCVEPQEEHEGDYWAHRIDSLKKEHQAINKLIEIEYDKQIQSTNAVFEQPTPLHEKIQKIKPCFEWRTRILQCYEDNPHQPLICSTAVQEFTKCVASCGASE